MAAACCSRTCASTPIGQSATSSPRPDQADRLSIRALFSPRRGVFDAAVSSASPLPNKEVPHRVGLRMLRCVTRLRLLQLCQLILHDLGRQRDETVLHHHLLTRLQKHQQLELAFQGRQGLVGLLIYKNKKKTQQKKNTQKNKHNQNQNKGLTFFIRERHSLHGGGQKTDAGITDAVDRCR